MAQRKALIQIGGTISELPAGDTLTGAGLPSGGTIGQVPTKNSSTDGDVSWQTPPAATGASKSFAIAVAVALG